MKNLFRSKSINHSFIYFNDFSLFVVVVGDESFERCLLDWWDTILTLFAGCTIDRQRSPSMSTTAAANQPPMSNLDERDRQMKQEEMIRQYLQVASTETSPLPPVAPPAVVPASFDFQDLRKEVKLGEERVERLRQELKGLQRKRDEAIVRSPPPYTSPAVNNPANELLHHHHHQISPSMNLRLSDRATPPLVQEVMPQMMSRSRIIFSFPSAVLFSTAKFKTDD